MVSSSPALAMHIASFRAVRNLTYHGESKVNLLIRKGLYDPPEGLGQLIEDQAQRGTGSGG